MLLIDTTKREVTQIQVFCLSYRIDGITIQTDKWTQWLGHLDSGIAVAISRLSMGIRVDVIGTYGASEAMKKLTKLLWLHDCDPSGRRLKWYKKRHDHYLKPSQLRHRKSRTISRMKNMTDGSYPALDGLEGWYVDDDLHF
jgi:hypothetical protein